eukprot:72440_1
MAECNWGVCILLIAPSNTWLPWCKQIVWSVLNLVCGIFITTANIFWALDGIFCGWYQLFFGVSIVWVSITTKCCDKYVLAWFPYWGNFLFMGCTFLYLSCGAYYCWGILIYI